MKVLFLQPPSPPYMNIKRDYAGGMGVADPSARAVYGHDADYITLPYMSLLYCAGVVERMGCQVAFIDAQAENLDQTALAQRIKTERPDVLVSVVNLPSIYGDCELLQMIKQGFPTVVFIVIGTVVDPLFELVARRSGVDLILRGDPEVVLPVVIERLACTGCADGEGFERRQGVLTNIEPGRLTDLDALPFLPYHLVPLDKYRYHGFGRGVSYAAVFASRGCSYRCYYCPYPVGFGGRIVHRDPVKVVDEIEALANNHGVRGILFRDQVFSMDRAKTIRLCDEMIRRHLPVDWVVETRLDRVDKELLLKMKQAGCKRIHYGLESGDPKLFSQVGKDGSEERLERVVENFRLTEKIGIHPHMFVLIGLVGETRETIRRTIETIRRLKPLTLQVAIVTPYPGTPLFEEARRHGLLLTEDWVRYTGYSAVLRTADLSGEDLIEARKEILQEHRRCTRWKWRGRRLRLLLRYAADGSLLRRLAGKLR